MSRGATLSIMGLYNADPTIFDLMAFPDKFTEAQKTIVKENILVECAELEFLYPAPDAAKLIIGIWSKKENPYWTRVYNASLLEYDPIENYRRNETEQISDGKTEEHSGSDVNVSGGADSLTRMGTETNAASGSDTNSGSSTSKETNSGTDTVSNKITGYDSNTLVSHDSSDTTHGHIIDNTASGSNTQQYGRRDTATHNTTDTQRFGKTDTYNHGEKIEHAGNTSRNLLAYGNIGTMTSQDMLTQELEVAKIVNVIPIIIESFKNRFCLMVY